MSDASPSQTNRLLGYPDDARLLIINADDFGMCHAINAAISHSLTDGLVMSTSLMTPCPWALHAMEWLAAHSDVSFAVHLTLVSEAPSYRWGPVAPKEQVPSLVDETGNFHRYDRIPELLATATIEEVEVEFRAQIVTALGDNLKPTHLDWHCLRNGGRADIFDLTVGLAKEYGLAVRVYDHPYIEQLHAQGLPAVEHTLLDSYSLDYRNPAAKAAQYAQMLRDLPPGLSEWAIHPGLDSAELQAVEPDSWQVRATDYAFALSPDARALIEQEGIILLDYHALQQAW